jgi:hypothetical protein
VPADQARFPLRVAVRRDGDDEFASSLTYPAGVVTRVQAKLEVPEDLASAGFPSVQYVMETSKGGKFASPVMCDGVRAHATRAGDVVLLDIDGTEPQIELFGVWATGHEAVTRTPTAVLVRQDGEL